MWPFLDDVKMRRNNRKVIHPSIVAGSRGGCSFDPITLQPIPTFGSSQTSIQDVVSRARKEMNLGKPGGSGDDIEMMYKDIEEEEERYKEFINDMERYSIVMFAIFFILFNIWYWFHLSTI